MHPGGRELRGLAAASVALLAAAFCRPVLRTAGFVAIGGWVLLTHADLVDGALLAQCALYVVGAACFLRNGGHDRPHGLADHHLLHYAVTAACGIHVANVVRHAAQLQHQHAA